MRRVTEDIVLPPNLCSARSGSGGGRRGGEAGYAISKGEQVICVARARQISEQEEDGWGGDAARWDCSRWIDVDDVAAGSASRGEAGSSEKKKIAGQGIAQGQRGQMWPFGGGTSMVSDSCVCLGLRLLRGRSNW